MVGAILYLFLGDTAVRQMIRLQKAEEHIIVIESQLKTDKRFAEIKAGRYTGNGGSIKVIGVVSPSRGIEDLKRLIAETSPPVPVSFLVGVRGPSGTVDYSWNDGQ